MGAGGILRRKRASTRRRLSLGRQYQDGGDGDCTRRARSHGLRRAPSNPIRPLLAAHQSLSASIFERKLKIGSLRFSRARSRSVERFGAAPARAASRYRLDRRRWRSRYRNLVLCFAGKLGVSKSISLRGHSSNVVAPWERRGRTGQNRSCRLAEQCGGEGKEKR
jgi:hypothetical protein